MVKNREVIYELGKRVRYLREEKGMSILDLSLEADINRNYLGDLERGKRNPTLDVLARLASGLGVSLSYLLNGIDLYR